MVNDTQNENVQVRISNLCRSFQEGDQTHRVLSHLNGEFFRGETIALRGRSGSGKSTLLNLISGIDAPDEGQVEIAGSVITTMSERERTLFRRRHIGFVYQFFNLVPTLTVEANVRLVLELNKIPAPEATQRVNDLLTAVDLFDRKLSYPDVLSGGEQQRVAIARALVHRPGLLLADEPTGNLDDAAGQSVLELLDQLVRQAGGTMIVATHSVAVAAFCDRVLKLHDGVLVADERRDPA
ncbi:MAG: ABC transporter ATP-binding protein [Gammaproteobacteria bacterium]|jgi:putative ABC transport system ATP-binding protein